MFAAIGTTVTILGAAAAIFAANYIITKTLEH
jgi:hypothetical protein